MTMVPSVVLVVGVQDKVAALFTPSKHPPSKQTFHLKVTHRCVKTILFVVVVMQGCRGGDDQEEGVEVGVGVRAEVRARCQDPRFVFQLFYISLY